MSEKGHQGWANYPTWAVNLWLSNEEPLYNMAREMARTAWAGAEEKNYSTRSQQARIALADGLKAWAEENAPEVGATLWGDLLTYAVGCIDWHETANSWLEDEEIDGYKPRD